MIGAGVLGAAGTPGRVGTGDTRIGKLDKFGCHPPIRCRIGGSSARVALGRVIA
jgi:hypothetical protein